MDIQILKYLTMVHQQCPCINPDENPLGFVAIYIICPIPPLTQIDQNRETSRHVFAQATLARSEQNFEIIRIGNIVFLTTHILRYLSLTLWTLTDAGGILN